METTPKRLGSGLPWHHKRRQWATAVTRADARRYFTVELACPAGLLGGVLKPGHRVAHRLHPDGSANQGAMKTRNDANLIRSVMNAIED